tara:strand:+ start:451 stop:1344 length:894 start_codon:yes stop_codon:yes gene_type:complete
VTVHDFSTVLGLLDFHKDSDPEDETISSNLGPKINLKRLDTLGRSHLHVCALDAQTSSKPIIDVTCARIIKLLLDTGSYDVNHQDLSGWTSLDYYSALGLPETVHMLASNEQVRINSVDFEYGRTALMRACINGNANVVGVLLESGADVNIASAKKSGGNSALHLAVRNHVMKRVVKQVENGGQCEWSTAGGADYGCEPGKEYRKIVRMLLDYEKTNLNLGNLNGTTPLMIAVQADDEEMVDLFLGVGERLDIEAKDIDDLGYMSYARSMEVKEKIGERVVELKMAQYQQSCEHKNP